MSGTSLTETQDISVRGHPDGGLSNAHAEIFYQLGDVEIDVSGRAIRCKGTDLKIGSRAFDLLVVLLRLRGMVVGKQEIIKEVWPTTTVDDSNLRFQMTCLRRALGASGNPIKTIPGRGYFLVASSVSVVGPDRPEGRAVPLSPNPSDLGHRGPATVAVLDDDKNVRDSLDSLLRSFGFRVQKYDSSYEFMKAGPPAVECLILDVWLPGRSGLDIQLDLKAAGVDVPIIFISGQADVPMSVKAMKAGAAEFLMKPVRHEEIVSAIHKAVKACPRPDMLMN